MSFPQCLCRIILPVMNCVIFSIQLTGVYRKPRSSTLRVILLSLLCIRINKSLRPQLLFLDMARGQQKIQSQQKNAKKQAGQKKKQGHDQKAAAKAALIYTCTVCRTQMPDPKTFKQHFESKHPKTPLPPELADVQA
nr:zinc finger protein 706 isoform X1 [Loxodonta africana]